MLNITDIRVRLVKKDDLKLKAVASITIDGCFVISIILTFENNFSKFFYLGIHKIGWLF